MLAKQVAITFGRTVNVGNYQSARLEVQIVAELTALDTTESVCADLWATAQAEVAEQEAKVRKETR